MQMVFMRTVVTAIPIYNVASLATLFLLSSQDSVMELATRQTGEYSLT